MQIPMIGFGYKQIIGNAGGHLFRKTFVNRILKLNNCSYESVSYLTIVAPTLQEKNLEIRGKEINDVYDSVRM
jgi:hypothetical protein